MRQPRDMNQPRSDPVGSEQYALYSPFQATAYAKNNRLRRSYLALNQARGLGSPCFYRRSEWPALFLQHLFRCGANLIQFPLVTAGKYFPLGDGKTPHFFRGGTMASILPWK